MLALWQSTFVVLDPSSCNFAVFNAISESRSSHHKFRQQLQSLLLFNRQPEQVACSGCFSKNRKVEQILESLHTFEFPHIQ